MYGYVAMRKMSELIRGQKMLPVSGLRYRVLKHTAIISVYNKNMHGLETEIFL